MAFKERNLDQIFESQQAASDFLRSETAHNRVLTIHEAIILQASSHLLIASATFKAPDILELVPVSHQSVEYGLKKFTTLEVFTRNRPEDSGGGWTAAYIYMPTQLGKQALAFFQDAA